jgi:hypothetical protein
MAPNMSSLHNNEFYSRLSTYMKIVTGQDPERREKAKELFGQLLEIVEHNEVSPTSVVQAFSAILLEYPSYMLLLLEHMRSVVWTSEMIGGYNYPEFFWALVEANVFSEVENIYDIMRPLSDLCDHDILRSYLTYAVATKDQSKQKNIIMAFHYVGHTMKSLKFVTDVIQPDRDNMDIYVFIYSHAMAFLYSERVNGLRDDDKLYLRTFFERGLQLDLPGITESCQKALNRLDQLSATSNPL